VVAVAAAVFVAAIVEYYYSFVLDNHAVQSYQDQERFCY
jgi:hypothetical protein